MLYTLQKCTGCSEKNVSVVSCYFRIAANIFCVDITVRINLTLKAVISSYFYNYKNKNIYFSCQKILVLLNGTFKIRHIIVIQHDSKLRSSINFKYNLYYKSINSDRYIFTIRLLMLGPNPKSTIEIDRYGNTYVFFLYFFTVGRFYADPTNRNVC